MIDFKEIYAEHHAALLRTTTRRCGDLQTAADVCSEAWAKAWRCRASYDPARGTVGAWLNCICRTTMIDHYGRQCVKLLTLVDEPEAPDDPLDLAAAIGKLPDPWADAIRAVYLEDRSFSAAAKAMTTLHYRAQKGLQRLRKILAA